jgi:uncharacterized protein YtpQ (UPF0354 family)
MCVYEKHTATTTLFLVYSVDLTNSRQIYGTNSLHDLALWHIFMDYK